MNKRFTGDPTKAAHVAPIERKRGADRVEGDHFTRTIPRVGDLDETARTFQAVIATARPVLRRDSKGPYLEVLAPLAWRSSTATIGHCCWIIAPRPEKLSAAQVVLLSRATLSSPRCALAWRMMWSRYFRGSATAS